MRFRLCSWHMLFSIQITFSYIPLKRIIPPKEAALFSPQSLSSILRLLKCHYFQVIVETKLYSKS